jgi:hypothetical protein
VVKRFTEIKNELQGKDGEREDVVEKEENKERRTI